MNLHVIRRKSDGYTLPQVVKARSYAEVCNDLPPRLFVDKRAASVTLDMWCQGYWYKPTSGSGYEYEEDVPMPSGKGARNKDEYEVVPVTLMIG